MNKYSKGFHTLMSEAGIISSESFDAYVNDVVGFNNIQSLNLDGFSWDPVPSIGFDFKEILVSNRVKVMATYVDKDSEAIPLGTEGLKMTEGVIPTQAARHIWDADDYRTYLDAVSRIQFGDGNVTDYALDLLFNTMTDIRSAHELSMTYQRDQMVSKGQLTLDADNNPRGIKGLVFSAKVPEGNVTKVKVNWFKSETDKTSDTADTTATPVNDLKSVVRSLNRKSIDRSRIICEVDYVSWLQDMDHPAWRTAFGYALRPDLELTSNAAGALTIGNGINDDELKAAFARQIGLPVENVHFRYGLAGVERLSGKGPDAVLERPTYRTFAPNTYVFYPEGQLGTIKRARALVPDDDAIYATFLNGSGLIQYDYDKKSMVQDWWSKLHALCVPKRPQEMYYVKTYNA